MLEMRVEDCRPVGGMGRGSLAQPVRRGWRSLLVYHKTNRTGPHLAIALHNESKT